ncbi:DedA family protein [Desulfosporosinus orientis]|uniref:DedA family protein n=1 Tax=Desulfosporosinus orientis TaxID=1563 RepID=UPI001FA7EE4A|nr:DedA family protein [Desulfosporosinus orientis]
MERTINLRGIEQYVIYAIYHHSYLALFSFLSLGMLGLPVPDELLMAFSGFLISIGRMTLAKTLLVSSLGSFAGVNLSYWLGRILGPPLFERLGPYLHLNAQKLNRAEDWFLRFGLKTVVAGYFFPGFRHFIAYFSGISKLPYRLYALLTGIGAVLWSITFISLGRMLGSHWKEITIILHHYLLRGSILLGIVLLFIYLWTTKQTNTINK